MSRIDELRKMLGIIHQFSYIPASLRADVLSWERELIELESENEKAS